jgi:hypothetical protein|tara:strand:+ start:53 stop:292 length:240 start_codon:yes stop_codon:yes gene_type:complete
MPEYDNTNKFVLFKNDNKDNDKQPDMRGTLNVNGEEYFISCWFNENQKVGKFIKGQVRSKEEVEAKKSAPAAAPVDMPF